MYVLSCDISVGSATFSAVHAVEVKRSIDKLTSTAVIKLPVTSVLRQSGGKTTTVETAQQLKLGDQVHIQLGYDGRNKTEFKGYLKSINQKVPLELECEGLSYELRRTFIKKSWPTGTLKDVLTEVVSGTSITLGEVETINIKNYVAKNKSGIAICSDLKQKYKLCVYIDGDGKLHATNEEDIKGDTAKYRLRYNIIKDEKLTWCEADGLKVKVTAVGTTAAGEKITATAGEDGGTAETITRHDVEEEKELEAIAQRRVNALTADGYKGEFVAFLVPYCVPGDVCNLDDELYSDRSGSYLVTGVKAEWGQSGARRTVSIGRKL